MGHLGHSSEDTFEPNERSNEQLDVRTMISKERAFIIGALCLLLLYLLLPSWSRASPDGIRIPPPSGTPAFRQRLVAVGDLHGGEEIAPVEV